MSIPSMALIAIGFLIGFALLGYAIWKVARAMQATTWDCIVGELQDVKFVEGDENSCEVEVTYAYDAQDVRNTGSLVAFGYSGSSARETHRRIYEKLQDAKNVTVRVNPANPGESVLTYGITHSQISLITAAIGVIAIATGSVIPYLTPDQNNAYDLMKCCALVFAMGLAASLFFVWRTDSRLLKRLTVR